MQHYSLTAASEHSLEILDRAKVEPVVLCDRNQPSHVILSYEMYRELLGHCEALDDEVWGNAAIQALKESNMVGESEFVSILTKLANGEA